MGGLTLGRTQLPPWSTNRSEAALYQFVLFAIKHNRRKWSRPPRRGRPSSSVMRLRSLRFHSPRLCRAAVFLIQTNVSLTEFPMKNPATPGTAQREREKERERGRGRGRERGGGRETERGDCKTAVRDDRRGSSVVARRASCWDELENSWERQPRRRVTADLSQISTFTQNRHVARLVETPLRSSLWARAKRAYLADLGSMVL